MRQSKLRMLIKLVEESNIGELEVSSWGRKVCIRKKPGSNSDNNHHNPSGFAPAQAQIPAPPPPRDERLEVSTLGPKAPQAVVNLVEIKSPMVGTFYKTPAPEARPYVEVGQNIKPGQVVCIVEAMKLMNEIESEIAGRVVEVLVENAKPVQFGQPLFLVEPA